MSEAAQLAPYSVVLTSCGRFDLLRETVASLLPHLVGPLDAFFIIEDSGDEAVRDALAPLEETLGKPFQFIVNQPQLGQMRSIDRAYAEVATPYVFHCEDDWLFERPGFIAESYRLLRARPEVSMVGLRPRAELNPRVRQSPQALLEDGRGEPVAYFDLDPKLHPEYFSYSFNPGLRRMEDYRRIGPFAPIGHEPDVSYAFKQAGFRIANLEAPATRHIGDGRHVVGAHSPEKPKNLGQRLARSTRKRWKRLKRLISG